MKTHELARALTALAQLLRSAPNQELDEFTRTARHVESSLNLDDIPTALATLVALSDFDKTQWSSLINELELPIEIRRRDASRDILGKILKYLETSPEARKKLRNRVQHQRSETSPELMRALQFLLRS